MKHIDSHLFTFVELLAVSVSLLTVAAVTVPAAKNAANSAFDTTCRENLKKIGAATAKYTGDNKGNYPVGLRNGKETWFSCMKPYVENELKSNKGKYIDPILSSSSDVPDQFGGIFRCPADQFRSSKSTIKAAYALSYAFHGNVGMGAKYGVTNEKDVKDAAVKVYRIDCIYTVKPNAAVNLSNYNWILGLNKKQQNRNGEIAFRHGENTVNLLLLDGHVTSLNEQECLKSASKMLVHTK